jgi:hypothetical protein
MMKKKPPREPIDTLLDTLVWMRRQAKRQGEWPPGIGEKPTRTAPRRNRSS